MKYAAGGLQPGETIHNFSQPGAVELRQPGEIKNNARMAVTEQLIEGQLQLLALDANLERTGELEDEDSRPEFFFDDLQRSLPIRDAVSFLRSLRRFKFPYPRKGIPGSSERRRRVRRVANFPSL